MKNSINWHKGPLKSLKQTSGRQDDDLVVFGLKPLINKVVSLMTFPFHWVSACKLVSLQSGIHINFVIDLNRLLKTHCIPRWDDLFCQLTQDGDMQPCKHTKNFIYRFHDDVYKLFSSWLNSKRIIVVLLFNRGFIYRNTVKQIQEYIAKLWTTASASVRKIVH